MARLLEQKEEERIFTSFKIKDLPEDIQKRHKFRVKKIEKLNKQRMKLEEEDEQDLIDLMRSKGEK